MITDSNSKQDTNEENLKKQEYQCGCTPEQAKEHHGILIDRILSVGEQKRYLYCGRVDYAISGPLDDRKERQTKEQGKGNY